MVSEVNEHLAGFRLDLASQALYEFVWNEYCDWYLEFTKPLLQSSDEATQSATRYTLLRVLETALRALHPIMPFITEEIWQRITPLLNDSDGLAERTICTQPYPIANEEAHDAAAEAEVDWIREVIQGVRRIRSEINLPPGRFLDVCFQGGDDEDRNKQSRATMILSQLGRVENMKWLEHHADTSQYAFALVGDMKVLVPLKGLVDVDAEVRRLGRQLEKETAELAKSKAKLDNERFINNAPVAVVNQEHDRLSAHGANVKYLTEQIEKLEALRD